MLISRKVWVQWSKPTKKYYIQKGYSFTNIGDMFEVDVNHLTKGSHVKVEVLCDYCNETKMSKTYKSYLKDVNNGNGKNCCVNCKKDKTRETNLLRYGVEHHSKLDSQKEKRKLTTLKKYGVENVSQNEEIKKKVRETSLKNWGVDNPFKSEEIKEKIVRKNVDKYGVDNYAKTDEFKEKITEVGMKKYGVKHPAMAQEVKDKIKKVNLEKYGVEYFMSTDEFKNKSKITLLEKYGVDHVSKNKEIREKQINTHTERYGVPYPLQNETIRKKVSETLYKNGTCATSKQQLAVFELLKENGFKVELNYPVGNLNLDVALFYEGQKIDIEYDGSYWHKSAIKDRRRDEYLKSEGWKILRIKSSTKVPSLYDILISLNKLTETDRLFTQILLDDWKKVN